MKTKNLLVLLTGYALLIIFLHGCATTPSGQDGSLSTYSLNGMKYISLISLCEKEGLDWNYDIVTKTITLEKAGQRIVVQPDESMVLVNGAMKDLRAPVRMDKGAVLLPIRFQQEIIDPLFKQNVVIVEKPSRPCSIRKIVIDAGHGGKDPGALGRSGLREKDVVLDIARRVVKYLEGKGKEGILTRSTDLFISLEQRAEIANKNNADLFVSIHANANNSRSMNGFEVYCLSNSVDDYTRAVAFVENNNRLDSETADFSSSTQNVKATVWDLVNTSNRQDAQDLAGAICHRMSSEMGIKTNGIKSGPFYVLKWTQMPAVLIEVGYVSNSSEEKMLKSSLYRQQLAEHIAAAILNYCNDVSLVKNE